MLAISGKAIVGIPYRAGDELDLTGSGRNSGESFADVDAAELSQLVSMLDWVLDRPARAGG